MKKRSVPTQLQGLQFLDLKLLSSSFGYCSRSEMKQKLPELSKIVEECMPCETHGRRAPSVAPPARQPPPLVCWLFKRGCNLKLVTGSLAVQTGLQFEISEDGGLEWNLVA
jgi:hypothetical protein